MTPNLINIILADDDEDDRLLFFDAFSELKMNTKVQLVNNGVLLLEYLKNETESLPNVIFLDLNMPRKSGMDCLREIKANPLYKEIVVVIYSTSASEADIEQTFIEGANVYIKKPNDFKTLKKVLCEVVTVNWQYQTSNLNRDNFLLRL
jgi:CheY-like chemotaxis protein